MNIKRRSPSEKKGFTDCMQFIIDWINDNPNKNLGDLLWLLETGLKTNEAFDRKLDEEGEIVIKKKLFLIEN